MTADTSRPLTTVGLGTTRTHRCMPFVKVTADSVIALRRSTDEYCNNPMATRLSALANGRRFSHTIGVVSLYRECRMPMTTKNPAPAQRTAKEKVIVKNRTTAVPSGTIKAKTAAGTIPCIESVLFFGETKLKDTKSRIFSVKTQVSTQTPRFAGVRRSGGGRNGWPNGKTGQPAQK